MSKLLPLLLLFTLILHAQKLKEDSSTYSEKIFKQDGVIKKIRIPNNQYRSNSKNYGLIIKFNDENLLDMAAFEAKYNLKFEKKLIIGYYIFTNNSSLNDMDLIEDIIENESNVYTVKQNAPLNPKIL
ncbi:MAG: hypothetical protein JXQ76_10025 [Campylobacterales bacterium]|nr:hypothetical protein [Campylobacterales bacterium]